MEVAAAAAMAPLLRKLREMLSDDDEGEHGSQQTESSTATRVEFESLSLVAELELIHAAVVLREVGAADVGGEEDEQVRLWAAEVRDLSYDMEDAVDAFFLLPRANDDDDDDGSSRRASSVTMEDVLTKFSNKTAELLSRGKSLHQISVAINEQDGSCTPEAAAHDAIAIDPRFKAAHEYAAELADVQGARDELIRQLCIDEQEEETKTKTVSIVGGLGKTALARATYDKIREKFTYGAFVSVSREPDMRKIMKKLLYEVNPYAKLGEDDRDEEQIPHEVKTFLEEQRYLIVIDDIWSEEAWGFIECVLPKNNLGSRVITTTRDDKVSKACCSSSDDIIYMMKSLRDDESKRLLCKRVLPQDSEIPHELEQVLTDILKKCGGEPLAIITVASALAGNGQEEVKPKCEWEHLLKSIGHGPEEGGNNTENMQMILSFSYDSLPSYLKPCLLYMSVFPRGYEIRRDRLIWRWIAEGFVQGGIQERRRPFEIGESYFNELINRNMIHPVDFDARGGAEACHVHDMVFGFISSLSSKEKFVTVLDRADQTSIASLQGEVRRLSFQDSTPELTTPNIAIESSTSMPQVRSVTLFTNNVDLNQFLPCFGVLRVLDLEGCRFVESDLLCIENLSYLRYLGLKETYYMSFPMGKAAILPREIGKLQFLQTIDARIGIFNAAELPSSVTELRRLICLYMDQFVNVPAGMGNLVSLQELDEVYVNGSSPGVEEELGELVELRVLSVLLDGITSSACDSLVESLGKLQKLQSLKVTGLRCESDNANWDGWVPPPHLTTLNLSRCTSTLPMWVNSSLLPLLSHLEICVGQVQLADIEILGKLPALGFLRLKSSRAYIFTERFICSDDAFPCLRTVYFEDSVTPPSMIPQGAMPMLEFFMFIVGSEDIASGGDTDVGVLHLPSLRRLEVMLSTSQGSSQQWEEAEAALRLAVDAHPNHPTLGITTV